MIKAVQFILVSTLLPLYAGAQSFYSARHNRNLILSSGFGTSSYYGDIANKGTYVNAAPNLNVGLQYFISKRIATRVELNWFTLAGDDKNADLEGRKIRNLSFQSSNFELSAIGIVNLFRNGDRYYRRPEFNAYGFAGIGLLYFNPRTTYNGTTYSLQPLKTEGVVYSLVTPVIPIGLGVRLKALSQINISIEAGWRVLFTDYLDDVSTVYLDNNSFTDPIAKALADRRVELGVPPLGAGSIRGSSKSNDAYMLLNVKLEYYLPTQFGAGNYRKSYSKSRKAYKKAGLKRRKR
jgi:hypothetical protein